MVRRRLLILGLLLFGVVVLAYGQYTASASAAREASMRSKVFVLRDAIDEYRAKTGKNPASLSQLVAGGYFPSHHPGIGEEDFKRLTSK